MTDPTTTAVDVAEATPQPNPVTYYIQELQQVAQKQLEALDEYSTLALHAYSSTDTAEQATFIGHYEQMMKAAEGLRNTFAGLAAMSGFVMSLQSASQAPVGPV
jgi:hypothetical protein